MKHDDKPRSSWREPPKGFSPLKARIALRNLERRALERLMLEQSQKDGGKNNADRSV